MPFAPVSTPTRRKLQTLGRAVLEAGQGGAPTPEFAPATPVSPQPRPAPVPGGFRPAPEPASERVKIQRLLDTMRPQLARLDPRTPEYQTLAAQVGKLEERLGQLRVPGVTGLLGVAQAYQENIIEPSAAGLVAGLERRVIPGQQRIERRAAELMAQGVNPDTARLQAYKETSMPSVGLPQGVQERIRGIPLVGGFIPTSLGLKGAAEIAADPFNLAPAPLGFAPTARGLAQAGRVGARAAGAVGRGIVETPAVREPLLKAAMPLKMAEEGAGRLSPLGRETIAYGPDPSKVYRMRYRLVELDDLITSHTDAFAPNPAYPQELQPRLRERGMARLTVQKMGRDLVPEALIVDSQVLDRGPMIIGSDLVMESGNGRAMSLRVARQSYPERWEAYQKTLQEAVPGLGFDEGQVAGMQNPVLVRERISDVDRVRFAAEANQPAVAAFSPLENALQDAKRINLDDLVVPEVTGALDTALRMPANRPFVARFLETLPETEQAALRDATGDLNLLGVQRLKAAMFARTYPGEAGRRLTQIFFESREPLIRNIEEGMMASLPQMARAEDMVRTGQRVAGLSTGEDFAAALDTLARLKQRKLTVKQYLGQTQMLQRELTPFQEQLLAHVDGLSGSPRKVREFLGDYADRVVASPHPKQATMFAGQPLTKEDLLNATIRSQTEGPLFAAAAEAPAVRVAEAPSAGLVEKVPSIPEAQVVPPAAKPPGDLDAILRQFEVEQAQELLPATEAEYIRQGMKAAEAEAKATGFALNKSYQRRELGEQYRRLKAQAPAAVPPGPIAAEVAPKPTGEQVLQALFRNLAVRQRNKSEMTRFLRENIRPAFFEAYGDVPVMTVTERQGEWFVAVSTAGWRDRVQRIGLEFVGEAGFDDLFRIPREPSARLPSARLPSARLPSARAAEPPPPAAAEAAQPAIPTQAETAIPSAPSKAAPPPMGPPKLPTPPTGGIPPVEPVLPRPRTLADMNREAKGMRAMTPEQRAALMDVAKPIEGDILYQARPFNEHAANLLGPDTSFMKALRSVPGVKQAFGAWNPAAMARDNPVAMIGLRQGIFQEIEKARIRFATLRWWNDADEAFGFKRSGTAFGLRPARGIWKATKVQPASASIERSKMFGTINDIIEHPERYALNDVQERVLALADNTLTQSVRDAQRAGVNVVELAEAYWPRSVIRGPKGEKGFAGIRRQVSAAKGYTHQRVFADVDDLVKAGFEVETDPRRVFASRLEAGIDTIAQANSRKQIAALPGVEKPLERMARRFPEVLGSAQQARTARDIAKAAVRKAGIKASSEEVMALRQAEADYITSMREVFAKKIEAGTPGYYELRLPSGRIAPQELVEEVGKFIDLPELRQAGTGGAARLTQEISQLLRTTLTNVDLAAGYIQGQTLFYRNNIAWWKAQGLSIVSLVDDPTAFVAKNFDLIDEGVRAGAIVAPTEFLFARQGIASIPLRIPYVGQGLGSFNRAFGWFITAGQTELYRTARSGVSKAAGMDELVSLGSAIRKQVGTESYAILGVRSNQRTMEALSLFAARFFRANVGLLGQSFTRGPGGAEARKAIGSLIAGGTALTIGINWAQNKKLPNMTDPYAPDWMQFRIGSTYFNAFGPMYVYFRTIARMSVALAEADPLKAANEAKRFLQSKESLPLRAIDIGGQLIYYGSAYVYGTKIEKTWASIVKGILSEFVTPISLQEIPSGFAEGRPEAALEFGGLIGRPVRVASEWANDLKAYRDIPSNENERKAKLSASKTPEERLRYGLSRRDYRTQNPEVDAKLFLVGAVESLQTGTAFTIAVRLMKENRLSIADIRGLEVQEFETQDRTALRWAFERELGAGAVPGTKQPAPTPEYYKGPGPGGGQSAPTPAAPSRPRPGYYQGPSP